MYDDQALSGPDVQLFGVVMLLMGSLPAGVLAWGLWRERSWTRAGLLIWWIGLSAVVAALGRWLPPMVGVVGVLGLLLYAPAFWWYLFRKRTVAEYYASVERAV
ncbi:MAG TPA: hypothetical protein VF006_03760 [Longimicrobium sp.]